MRRFRHAWALACCALLPLVQACDRPGDSDTALGDPQAAVEEPQPGVDAAAPGQAPLTQVLTGELQSIDPERGMLLVRTPDGDLEVDYTTDTEIVGGLSSVQGLAGQPDSLVTVSYRMDPASARRIAVRIEPG